MSEELQNEEIKRLLNKINSVKYSKKRFKVKVGDDKYIFGYLSGKNTIDAPLGKLMQYKTLYDTLRDLNYKIRISFKKAIIFAYSNKLQNEFNLIQTCSIEETYAYYYIENALFRTSSLWDLLAQFYRLYYKIEIKSHKVNYKEIFNPSNKECNSFKAQAKEIYAYLNQKNDSNCHEELKGNHEYLSSCRNKMTHRNSPNVTSISDFDDNIKDYPAFMLKRIIEDYCVVSKYIGIILNKIEKEVKERRNENNG